MKLSLNRHITIHWFLYLVMITLPFLINVNNYAIGLWVISWLFCIPELDFQRVIRKTDFWLLSAFFLFIPIGLLYSKDINMGMKVLERSISFVLIPLMIYSYKFDKQLLIKALKVFVVFIIAACIISLGIAVSRNLEYGALHDKGLLYINPWFFSYKMLASTIATQPTYYAMFISFSMWALIVSLWKTGQLLVFKISKLLHWVMILFLGVFVVLLSSRIILLANVFIALVIIPILFRKHILIWKYLGISMVVIIGMTLLLLSNPVIKKRVVHELSFKSEPVAEQVFSGFSLRIVLWEAIWNEVTKEHWFIGDGTDVDLEAYGAAYEEYGVTADVTKNFNAHNQYLETLTNHGVLQLLVLIAFLGYHVRHAIKTENSLYIIVLTLLIFAMLTESILLRQKGIIFFALFPTLFSKLAETN